MIYMVQAGENGPVKIGTAIDVPARIRELQCGNPEPLRLLRTLDGGRDAEAWFHRHFRSSRYRAEWFSFCEEMLTAIPVPQVPRGGMSELCTASEIEDRARATGRNMTQICREARVAPSIFSRWKNGQTTPSLENYSRLLSALTVAENMPAQVAA